MDRSFYEDSRIRVTDQLISRKNGWILQMCQVESVEVRTGKVKLQVSQIILPLTLFSLFYGWISALILFCGALTWFYSTYLAYSSVFVRMVDGRKLRVRTFPYHRRYCAYDLSDAVRLGMNESGQNLRMEEKLKLTEEEKVGRLKDMFQRTQVEKTPEMEQILETHLQNEQEKKKESAGNAR